MRQLQQMLRLAREGERVRSGERWASRDRPSRTTSSEPRRRACGGPCPPRCDPVLRRLFAPASVRPELRRRVEPDWAWLARGGSASVDLMVLWEEYRDAHPDGYGYDRFCDLFRGFERRLSPVMRQHHAAGDKVFVDYSGKKVPSSTP